MAADSDVSTPRERDAIRLYRPGLLLAYFVLGGLPIGMFTYGLNISRRDSRALGLVTAGLAAALFVVMIVAALAGNRISGLGILSIFVGLGVFKMESSRYQRAVERGARSERWWPPLLGALAVAIVLALIVPTPE